MILTTYSGLRSLKTSTPSHVPATPSSSADQQLPTTKLAMAGSNQLSLETPQNKAGASILLYESYSRPNLLIIILILQVTARTKGKDPSSHMSTSDTIMLTCGCASSSAVTGACRIGVPLQSAGSPEHIYQPAQYLHDSVKKKVKSNEKYTGAHGRNHGQRNTNSGSNHHRLHTSP
jgi:hypothetical protein